MYAIFCCTLYLGSYCTCIGLINYTCHVRKRPEKLHRVPILSKIEFVATRTPCFDVDSRGGARARNTSWYYITLFLPWLITHAFSVHGHVLYTGSAHDLRLRFVRTPISLILYRCPQFSTFKIVALHQMLSNLYGSRFFAICKLWDITPWHFCLSHRFWRGINAHNSAISRCP